MFYVNWCSFLLTLMTCSLGWTKQIWIDENGGYHGILIAVDQTVQITDCYDFSRRIESLATEFSKNIWHATNQQLHVASLDVVLPQHMQKYCSIKTHSAVAEHWNTADIRISHDWSLYEQWNPEGSMGIGVQQPSGCGAAGDFVTLNASTFSDIPISRKSFQQNFKNSTKPSQTLQLVGQSLAMGWARYRWGIFEEFSQTSANRTMNNSDRPDVSTMKMIDAELNASLCNEQTHNFEVYNKQNIMCQDLSSWQVMQQHADFNRPQTTTTIKNEKLPGVVENVSAPTVPREISADFDLMVVARTKRDSQVEAMPVAAKHLSEAAIARVVNAGDIPKDEKVSPKLPAVADKQRQESTPPTPTIRLLTPASKVVILALDLSSQSIAQASVEWIRGGILRWLFGLGQGVNVAILASYSNTSFPLSLGPLSPGPAFSHELEEHLALLPFQHEIDDNVYGGSYCLSCIMDETRKILKTANVPSQSATLILSTCQPQLTASDELAAANSDISIHTIALCPDTPLSVDTMASPDASWALSTARSTSAPAVETQLAKTLAQITKQTLLWPGDSQLIVVQEEEKVLKESDVERVGPYRRVRGSITVESSPAPRLVVLTTSSPAKVVELWARGRRIALHRDTPRRYWVLLDQGIDVLSYAFKFLSTSLDLPLTVTTGVYERCHSEGLRVNLRTSARRYSPQAGDKFLSVWAEVTNNGKRVLNADVTLSLTYLGGPTTATYSVRLLDDGSTEPDVRSNDGIYSRYFTWTPGVGRYILTATASSTPMSLTKDYQDSRIISTRTGQFSSVSTSVSLIVDQIPRGDIYPPSRVTDLSSTQIAEELVELSWTAPGGDLDQGSAYQYELKIHTDRGALQEDTFDLPGFPVFCLKQSEDASAPVPALFGTKQYCKMSIPFTGYNWFLALRAIDGANNTGLISNIVFVHVSAPEPSVVVTELDQFESVLSADGSVVGTNISSVEIEQSVAWKMYGLVLLVVVLCGMFVVVVCACICCCRTPKLPVDTEDRPIYKIYVNNACIQEDDGEIKVVGKNKTIDDKDHTQQWINSLDGLKNGDLTDQLNQSKFSKPVRFGVLTNGSIMREPSSTSSSSSKPSDDSTMEDFKYKDLSETISNSTTEEGLTGSTASTATDSGPSFDKELRPSHAASYIPPQILGNFNMPYQVETAYPPLGIPPIPAPKAVPVHPPAHACSDDEGGFRPHSSRKNPAAQFASCRYLPQPTGAPQPADALHNTSTSSRTTTLSHGTVRSVKKRRHISFV